MSVAAGALCLAMAGAGVASSAHAAVLCDNTNRMGVTQGPGLRAPRTACVLPQAAHITSISTYHWNGGRGAIVSQINVVNATTGVGMGLAPQGSGGQNNASNVNWTGLTNINVAAGTTLWISDSSPQTWSFNSASGGDGFIRVEGDWGAVGPTPNPFTPPRPSIQLPPGPPTLAGPTPGAGCVRGSQVGVITSTCYVPVTPAGPVATTFVLTRALPAAPAVIKLVPPRSTSGVSVALAGAGLGPGSTYTFAAPFALCTNPRTMYLTILYSAAGVQLGSVGTIEGYPC